MHTSVRSVIFDAANSDDAHLKYIICWTWITLGRGEVTGLTPDSLGSSHTSKSLCT